MERVIGWSTLKGQACGAAAAERKPFLTVVQRRVPPVTLVLDIEHHHRQRAKQDLARAGEQEHDGSGAVQRAAAAAGSAHGRACCMPPCCATAPLRALQTRQSNTHEIAHADAVDGLLTKPGVIREVPRKAAHNPLQQRGGAVEALRRASNS